MNKGSVSEEVAKKLKEIYLNDLKKIILENLDRLSKDENGAKNCDIPWFGDVFSWRNVLRKKCTPKLFKNLSAPLGWDDKKLRNLGKDLHNLLPENDLVKAFLPIILTNYVSICSQMSDVHEILCDDLFNEALPRQLERYWAPLPWKERYKKLSYKNCKTTNIHRTLPVYTNAIQFLMFLKRTERFCNVGLSFYVFEQLTGYLHLFDCRAHFFCTKVEAEYSERLKNAKGGPIPIEVITEKTECDDEIISFIDGIVAELTKRYPTCATTKHKRRRKPNLLVIVKKSGPGQEKSGLWD